MNKFSIIIATHNAQKGLKKTLESIFTQSYSNFEVLIIDSLSSDNTLSIVKRYQEKFPHKINCISEKDKGIYDAMNKGVKLAKGEWLYFIGSGDALYKSNTLKNISNLLSDKTPDVLYGNVKWGNTNVVMHGKFNKSKLIEQNICHQAVFYKKKIFKRIGLFNLKYKACADYLFNIKVFSDKSLRTIYTSTIIATFDNTGYSSLNRDNLFDTDKKNIVKKYFPFYSRFFFIIRINIKRIIKFFNLLIRGDFKELRTKINKVMESHHED